MSDDFDDDDDDLFSHHARRSDPSTSKEAVPKNLAAQALRVLHGYVPGDAILDHEAYRRVGMVNTGYAHQRCSDLREWNLIERTGERGVTPSGKKGYLCRITQAGRDYLATYGNQYLRSSR